MFVVGKFDASVACDASFRSLTNEYWRQSVHSRRANVVGWLSKRFLRTRSKNPVNRVWFEKLFWGPSGPSPIISPTSHLFSLYKQVKNKPVSQWDAPHRWELQLLTMFPGCIPGTCPPRRFYNTLHLHKVLLGNLKKSGPVNEWPLKRILPLVFCCSHGLVWFIILQQEVNKDTFEHRCIQIHRKEKKIQSQTFLLEPTRARCCWRIAHRDNCFLLFYSGSITDEANYYCSTLSASAFRLLWRNLQTFPRLEQHPVQFQ